MLAARRVVSGCVFRVICPPRAFRGVIFCGRVWCDSAYSEGCRRRWRITCTALRWIASEYLIGVFAILVKGRDPGGGKLLKLPGNSQKKKSKIDCFIILK